MKKLKYLSIFLLIVFLTLMQSSSVFEGSSNEAKADTFTVEQSKFWTSFAIMDTLKTDTLLGANRDSIFHLKDLKTFWDEIGWSFTQLDTNGLQAGGSAGTVVVETKDPKSGRWSVVGLIPVLSPVADSVKQTVTVRSDGTTMEFGQFKTGDNDLRARITNTNYNKKRRILVTCKGVKH